MCSKLIKKVISYGVLKIVDCEKGELLDNDEFVTRYSDDTEIVCHENQVDYIIELLGEVRSVLDVNGIRCSDYIKTVYHHTEAFNSAFVASTFCIKDIEQWNGAAKDEQDRLISNLVYQALLAKEFQENKKFTGFGLISKYTKERDKELINQAEKMVYQRSLLLFQRKLSSSLTS